MKKSVSRILSLLLTLSLCAGMLMVPVWAAETPTAAPDAAAEPAESAEPTAPAEDVDSAEPADAMSVTHGDVTLTATVDEDGKYTVSAAGMQEEDVWAVNIHATKDNANRYSMVTTDGKLSDFMTFEEAVEFIGTDEYRENAFIEANGSISFELVIPEEYADWDLAIRISLPGQVFEEIPLVDEEPAEPAESAEPAEPTEPAEPAEPTEVSFTDVTEDRWYYSFVNTIAKAGWMNGNTDGTFDPTGNVQVAQVLVIAARIHAASFEKEIAPVEEGPWYTQYVNYCVENGIIEEDAFTAEDMTRAATRFEVVEILDKAPQPARFEAMREVADGYIPDLAEADEHGETVYKWYRAGIIDGNTEHEFTGANTITRAETAVMLCRVMVLVERITK